jgi:hypothetical protein
MSEYREIVIDVALKPVYSRFQAGLKRNGVTSPRARMARRAAAVGRRARVGTGNGARGAG